MSIHDSLRMLCYSTILETTLVMPSRSPHHSLSMLINLVSRYVDAINQAYLAASSDSDPDKLYRFRSFGLVLE